MRFRKKNIEVEAVQYTEYGKLTTGMCNSVSCHCSGNKEPHVHTIHDNQIVYLEIGDFIIPEPDGIHFYPCRPNIFRETYEEVGIDMDVRLSELEKYILSEFPDGCGIRECSPDCPLNNSYLCDFMSRLSDNSINDGP